MCNISNFIHNFSLSSNLCCFRLNNLLRPAMNRGTWRIHRTHPSNLGKRRTHLLEPWRLDSIHRLIQDVIGLQKRPSKDTVLNFDKAILNDIRESVNLCLLNLWLQEPGCVTQNTEFWNFKLNFRPESNETEFSIQSKAIFKANKFNFNHYTQFQFSEINFQTNAFNFKVHKYRFSLSNSNSVSDGTSFIPWRVSKNVQIKHWNFDWIDKEVTLNLFETLLTPSRTAGKAL
ncbi:hypothetical protein ILYODFUR_025841 [Ilyodon furcidens]|uniref:Uncharacterized protein n=1 Tax=Ilyodon furcidens TaxID=33524 RepID=A0ABV0TNL9_9TELE